MLDALAPMILPMVMAQLADADAQAGLSNMLLSELVAAGVTGIELSPAALVRLDGMADAYGDDTDTDAQAAPCVVDTADGLTLILSTILGRFGLALLVEPAPRAYDAQSATYGPEWFQVKGGAQ